jgi:alkanesulfonate monooxygenase SsuD/methylene tetrahydromethanopterin reductase-like flavin-dependent oxidoreductase (luciferase family)
MRLSTVILPAYRWAQASLIWKRAEELNFFAAYTYDHLSWRSFVAEPWFGAVPTLTAAAAITDRIRLGTMVASPNFRHPVPFAKDVMTIDDISSGRMVLGIGSGGTGFDATALGQQPWSMGERTARFAEFTAMLHQLLSNPVTNHEGQFWSAHEARMIPGGYNQTCVPFAIAATGPRGFALAAQFGQSWISTGDPELKDDTDIDHHIAAIKDQVTRVDAAALDHGRPAGNLNHILLTGAGTPVPLQSVDAFVDYAGQLKAAGIDELVVHWPVPDSVFDADLDSFVRIATEAPGQLH